MAKKKILIVEDDLMLMEMIRIQLETLDYEVIEAENGKDGLFKAISEHPNVILADIMMPELDGNQMIKMMRSESRLRKTPIIVISALGRDEDIEASMKAGANDYITKPFHIDDITKAIEKYKK